jgi:hypothetical protein
MSPHPYRREKWETPPTDIGQFCKVFKGYGEVNIHRLTGSEVTMTPIPKLRKIINIFRKHGRKLSLITNGYNLLGLGKEHINKVGGIILDDHGINRKHVERCVKYLRQFYGGDVKVLRQYVHWDLDAAMNHPSNKGKDCRSMMRSPMLVKSIVYPCCNMYPIEQIRRDPQITHELVDAGWTLNSPSLVKTLRNWRKTLPSYIRKQCLYNCWRPNMKVGRSMDITLKPHDVIAAGEKLD